MFIELSFLCVAHQLHVSVTPTSIRVRLIRWCEHYESCSHCVCHCMCVLLVIIVNKGGTLKPSSPRRTPRCFNQFSISVTLYVDVGLPYGRINESDSRMPMTETNISAPYATHVISVFRYLKKKHNFCNIYYTLMSVFVEAILYGTSAEPFDSSIV